VQYAKQDVFGTKVVVSHPPHPFTRFDQRLLCQGETGMRLLLGMRISKASPASLRTSSRDPYRRQCAREHLL
jgi:hypothetical protein